MKDQYWLKDKLTEIYRRINRGNWEIKVILVVVMLCIFADLVPWEYWPAAERIFAREAGDYAVIPALILVVWTFTTTMIVFWMGRMEDKRYGIRTIAVFLQGLSPSKDSSPYNKLAGMCVAFVAELMAVFAAAMYKLEITLTVMVVLEIVTMGYVFLMICVESSQSNVLEQIRQNSIDYIRREKGVKQGDGINVLLVKMVGSTNYKDEYEINQLEDMIVKIIEELTEESLSLQWFMKGYIDYIIKVCGSRQTVTQIVKSLMVRLEDRYAKTGIFLSVIENAYQQDAPEVQDIAELEFADRRIIIATGLAYNGFYNIIEHESNRRYVTPVLRKCLMYTLEDDELKEIFEIWEKLIQENRGNGEEQLLDWSLDKLWKVISMEREG